MAGSPPSPGMFNWVKGGNFLSRVVERTKTMSESVITTLDPQMKEFIKSGGDVEVVVASDKEGKVAPLREAFQVRGEEEGKEEGEGKEGEEEGKEDEEG